MQEDGYFVTSIPYDKGFTVKVDGKKVKIEKVNTAFLGFKLEKGKHKIKITYTSPYKQKGLVITIIGLLSITILIIHDKKIKRLK